MTRGDPAERDVEVGGVRLHYLEWGPPGGRPVLLLHGLTSHAHAWDALAPALAGSCRALALDQRGHGDSAWAEPYDAEAFVADLEGFVAALGLSPPATRRRQRRLAVASGKGPFGSPRNRRFRGLDLVGHSLGGRHAIIFAARHPRLVERLVIVDFGPEVMPEGVARLREAAATTPELFPDPEEAVALMVAQSPQADPATVRHRTLHNLRQLPDGRWSWRFDPALRSPLATGPSPDLWALLPRIRCPALVVRGAKSDLLATEVAEAMARALPQGELVTIPGAGHRVPLEQPAAFAGAVLRFLGLQG